MPKTPKVFECYAKDFRGETLTIVIQDPREPTKSIVYDIPHRNGVAQLQADLTAVLCKFIETEYEGSPRI